MVAPADAKPTPSTASKDAGKAAVDVSFEEDDVFEEFASQAVIEGVAPAQEEALLWEVDWDDEDQRDDFLPRVKQELAAKSMTE